MSKTASYTLTQPIEHGGRTITALTFREATFGDMIASDAVAGEMAKTAVVLAAMAGIPYEAMRAVVYNDVEAMMRVAAPLMGNGLASATSGEPSPD